MMSWHELFSLEELILKLRYTQISHNTVFQQTTEIDLFTDTTAIFKEYYGMPRGHSLSIYARFSGKKRTSLCISREKVDHYHIQHGTTIFFFSHYNLFLGNLKEKFARKAGVNTGRVHRTVLMSPLGIP